MLRLIVQLIMLKRVISGQWELSYTKCCMERNLFMERMKNRSLKTLLRKN